MTTALIIWNFSSGEIVYKLLGHTEYVRTLEITPDDKYVISGSDDQTMKIWEIDTGKYVCTKEVKHHIYNIKLSDSPIHPEIVD